ncbi:MAG: hypothetical protein AVDCRST_MAG40-925, partial [uncultured Gemmatimonadaceae bacterium]
VPHRRHRRSRVRRSPLGAADPRSDRRQVVGDDPHG